MLNNLGSKKMLKNGRYKFAAIIVPKMVVGGKKVQLAA